MAPMLSVTFNEMLSLHKGEQCELPVRAQHKATPTHSLAVPDDIVNIDKDTSTLSAKLRLHNNVSINRNAKLIHYRTHS